MKIKTLVVAPYPGLVELMTSLKAELIDFDITVIQGDLSEVLPMLNGFHDEAFEMIISRGGTARLLRQHSHLPVIDIQVSGFDILRILMLVKGYQSKMKMVGFPNIIEGFVSVSGLMDVNIPYAVIQHENEVDEVLQSAKTDGFKIIVGDTITIKKAADNGLQGVLITSGRESVLEAFAQAKQIYKISERYKQKNQVFEMLLESMGAGYAIVEADGTLQFADHAFRQRLRLSNDQKKLYDKYPHFERLILELAKGLNLELLMTVESDQQIALSGGTLPNPRGNALFYLKMQTDTHSENGIKIRYVNHTDNTFPQLIRTGMDFGENGLSTESFPIAIYGENGVGKRLYTCNQWIGKSHEKRTLVELDIPKAAESSLPTLKTFLEAGQVEEVIYIQGSEHMPVQDQKELVSIIQKSKRHVIFSFEEDPTELRGRKKLDGKLYEAFEHRIIFIPPLRDRLQDLDEYIRTFLITFNEKYGKQIVGLRTGVMEALCERKWKNNLFELKKIVELFVKHTDGEYVEEDVLPLIRQFDQEEQAANQAGSLMNGIDMNRTLDEIEHDIIRIVLEQEDMNQSTAAKRLGINRSTLWRKMKV
jgi:propionate catabolism operon transcriptional regulator